MYTPAAFQQTDPTKLHDFIESHSFALLVSNHSGEPFATHLPLLLDRDDGPQGTLFGHVAKANPQWEQADGQQVLAVFSGPHSYISPSWYEADDVVPTWNYVAAHVYGTFQRIDETGELLAHLRRMVATYERPQTKPWELPANAFVNQLAEAIVGFRIEITRIEGKWKLSQNHSQDRRQKVIKALREQNSNNAQRIARLMEETHPGEPGQ